MKKDIVREEVVKKVLLFDLETSLISVNTFQNDTDRYKRFVSCNRESRLLAFSYKWDGQQDIICLVEKDFKNNEGLVKELWKLFDEADIIVAHNGKKFDVPWANTYFVEKGLPPPSPYKVFDTVDFARHKFNFFSNRLDYLLNKFYKTTKEKILDKDGLWKRLSEGTASKEDWELCRKYCRKDLFGLNNIWLLEKPWTSRHPAVYINDKGLCPMCGSDKLIQRGWQFNANGLKRKRYVCKKCGKWSESTWSVRFADENNMIK